MISDLEAQAVRVKKPSNRPWNNRPNSCTPKCGISLKASAKYVCTYDINMVIIYLNKQDNFE